MSKTNAVQRAAKALLGPDEPDDVFSTADLTAEMNQVGPGPLTRNAIQKRIASAIDRGEMELAGYWPRPDGTGRRQPTPLYRLVKGD